MRSQLCREALAQSVGEQHRLRDLDSATELSQKFDRRSTLPGLRLGQTTCDEQ